MADYISTLAHATRVGKDQQPADPISKDTCKKRQRDGRRLVAYWQSQHPGAEIDWHAVFTADNAEAAANWDFPAARQESQGQIVKDGTASTTLDSIAASAMFFIRQHCHQQHGDGEPLPQPCQLALQQLERLQKDARETANAAKQPPPELSVYQDFGKELHTALLAWQEAEQPSHEQLALACMAVLTIFGMPARSAAMRDYQWDREITRLEDGDYQIEVGTPGGSKNDAYCKFLLSDLSSIGQTGLLRADLTATALDTLHAAGNGSGLVFSRTADGESRFGGDRLRNFLKDHGLSVGDLRRRIETDADELGRRGVLSEQDRELVTYVCQHTVTAADQDYVHNQAAAQADDGSSDDGLNDDGGDHDDGGGDHDDGGGGGPGDNDPELDAGGHEEAPDRVDWLPLVAAHTQRLYTSIANDDDHSSRELIMLNMTLAMASYNHLYNEPPFLEERTMLRHAGAACDMMNAMKRRRLQ